jgi:hypothetical protein
VLVHLDHVASFIVNADQSVTAFDPLHPKREGRVRSASATARLRYLRDIVPNYSLVGLK